jgi:CRP-like cAMP-binding protein
VARNPTAFGRKAPRFDHRPNPDLPPIASDAIALLELKAGSRNFRPGREIVSEGRRCNSVFLILEGFAIRYRILRNGQRQILNFLLPGDFAGVTNCHFGTAIFTVKTLTDATVAPIPLARLMSLFQTHPQLAAQLFWLFAAGDAVVSEHLIAIGRRPATERIAHLLLELLNRLQRIGLADEQSFHLPLTQEIIADALGLSVPYVNRVLQQLRANGLVRIGDHMITIENIEELSALADFEQAYLKPLPITELLADRA